MEACPYCGFEATDFSQEIAHMTTWHPEIVAERLNRIGEDITAEQIRATAGPDVPPRSDGGREQEDDQDDEQDREQEPDKSR